MRRPGDQTPDPPGGRAAERMRDFVQRRQPGGIGPVTDETPAPAAPDCAPEDEGEPSEKQPESR